MESFAQIQENEFLDPIAVLNMARTCHKTGLTHQEVFVLSALMETAVLVPGEPSAALSRHELAGRIGISWQAVQRVLPKLERSGFITRRQNIKAKGETAITTLTRKAYALFGQAGGAEMGQGVLPAELNELLTGETEAVITVVAQCWRTGTLPSAEQSVLYRGGARRWAQIEFLLTSNIEAVLLEAAKVAAEIEIEKAEEEQGRFILDLPNGDSVVFDQAAFKEAAQELDNGIKGSDVRFARDVVQRLVDRAPGRFPVSAIPMLAAEILFSRQKGFVWRHDYSDACKVLAAQLAKQTWSKPKGITSEWYATAKHAVVVYPQGVRN